MLILARGVGRFGGRISKELCQLLEKVTFAPRPHSRHSIFLPSRAAALGEVDAADLPIRQRVKDEVVAWC
ncbi:MAG TPA: hypothetical protein VGM17_00950, partial [Rhizomicrobium sp.]|jgi:hypothetical protein